MCQILQRCEHVWIMGEYKIRLVLRELFKQFERSEVGGRARYADAARWARLNMQTTGVNTCMTSRSAL